jgi:AraC family transcriptional regulator
MEQRLLDYVEAHLRRDIGLNDLARVAGLSRYHFLRVFKRTTGHTPYRYLVGRRIAMAERLLRERKMSVAEIALAVGFKDATRLNRVFRKILKIAPARFRTSDGGAP